MSTSTGNIYRELAMGETQVMYELVFCIPSCEGFATFAGQRKRFATMEHALVYARMHMNTKEQGIHFAIISGTRAEVASTKGMRPKKELLDYTGDMAHPDAYRFAIALTADDGKKVLSTDIDNDQMRFVKAEDAERTLKFVRKHCVMPADIDKKNLKIISVKGMEGVV